MRPSILALCLLVLACVPDGARGAAVRAGTIVAEIQADDRPGVTVTARGPVQFRLRAGQLSLAARLLREGPGGGVVVGDLSLRLGLPAPGLGSVRLDASSFVATYREAQPVPGQARSEAFYAGLGTVRLEQSGGGLYLAFELDFAFRGGDAAGRPARVVLRGLVFTDDALGGAFVDVYALGLGVWAYPFDPYPIALAPDLEFVGYLEAHPGDAAWLTAPFYDPYSGESFRYGGIDGSGAYVPPPIDGWTDDYGGDPWDTGYDDGGDPWDTGGDDGA